MFQQYGVLALAVATFVVVFLLSTEKVHFAVRLHLPAWENEKYSTRTYRTCRVCGKRELLGGVHNLKLAR